LLDFIEAQNSIIGRRLVSESKINNIDIVETLKARRENKKDMRERLQNIKSNQVNPQQPTPSTDLENEYTNELRSILREELQRKVIDVREGNGLAKPSVNLSNECNQKLFMLESNPKYISINKAQIKASEIQRLDVEYFNIIEKEQITNINMLIDSLNTLFATVPNDVVKRDFFEEILRERIDEIIKKYPTINSLNYMLDLENNLFELNFEWQRLNFVTNQYEVQKETKQDRQVLNDSLRKDYLEARKAPAPTDDLKPQSDPSEVKISTRQLTFNPKQETQIASKVGSLVMEGNEITISLIKNGIRIKYSQELREKLSQLNAKINLVNKDNSRSRISVGVDSDVQDLAFKDEREIKPEDYKIEVRIPSDDKSSVLFEYDLENVSE
ncbi:MAG: hypothetical protein K2H20_02700, partial [Bacilli bacterium]|nr:hypothetical protein [Bacilli bacterium]